MSYHNFQDTPKNLDEIFLDGPLDINAYINNDIIELHWNQPNYPENDAILGFNIYRNGEYLTSTVEEEYIVTKNGLKKISLYHLDKV